MEWTYSSNPADREYIDLMNSLDKTKNRPFPIVYWQPFTIDRIPHIKGAAGTLAPVSNNPGYHVYMFYNTETNVTGGAKFSTTDAPIFHIEEVLLNYAEAMYDLGKFDQGVADRTINKLRPRAGVKNMEMASIDENFDPARDRTVSPVLWEIRRDRMAELMGEGFGFYDIRRWKRAEYFVNSQPIGVRMSKDGMPSALKWITTGSDTGNLLERSLNINSPIKLDYLYLELNNDYFANNADFKTAEAYTKDV